MSQEPVSQDLDTRRRRAAYRAAHRGTKEMDWLVGRYADARLEAMQGAALDSFERFLEISDVELQKWILAPELAEGGEFAGLVRDLRVFHGLE